MGSFSSGHHLARRIHLCSFNQTAAASSESKQTASSGGEKERESDSKENLAISSDTSPTPPSLRSKDERDFAQQVFDSDGVCEEMSFPVHVTSDALLLGCKKGSLPQA